MNPDRDEMNLKITNDISFTEWLHAKYGRGRSCKTYIADTLINMIIMNDLDVEIKDADQLYTEVISFLRLYAPSAEFIDFFKKVWKEYRKQTFQLKYYI